MRLFYIVVSFLFLSAAISGCAAKDQAKPQHVDAVEQEEAIIIAPSSFYEACDKLTEGQKVKYSFTTTSPVHFNVHYHSRTEGIIYPVKEENISYSRGDMVAEVQAIYCCMWANRQTSPVTLTHEFVTLADNE
jgi:hypothetical protein